MPCTRDEPRSTRADGSPAGAPRPSAGPRDDRGSLPTPAPVPPAVGTAPSGSSRGRRDLLPALSSRRGLQSPHVGRLGERSRPVPDRDGGTGRGAGDRPAARVTCAPTWPRWPTADCGRAGARMPAPASPASCRWCAAICVSASTRVCLDVSPALGMRSPKLPRRLPAVLAQEQVGRLLDDWGGEEPLDLRDRALYELVYSCGLRCQEVIDLRMGDVDIEGREVRVTGKREQGAGSARGRRGCRSLCAAISRPVVRCSAVAPSPLVTTASS